MAEFNALLQELLVGTEIQTSDLESARTREKVVRCIRYKRKDRTLVVKPPGRVKMLMDLLSSWVNITQGVAGTSEGKGGDAEEVQGSTRVLPGMEPAVDI